MSSRENIDLIVRQVQEWPTEDRVALANEILRDLARRPLAPAPRNTLSLAAGLLWSDQPPPTDEQVERWIEEHRMGKYGSMR